MYILDGFLYYGTYDPDSKVSARKTAGRAKQKHYDDPKIPDHTSISKKIGKLTDSFAKGASNLLDRIKGGAKEGSIAKQTNMSRGGMPRKRIGNLDYRKGGMVVNTVDNRKNK